MIQCILVFWLCLVQTSFAAGPPDIDSPLRTGVPHAKDAGVVIGIEKYAFIPRVPHAERDADATYNFLLYTRGVPQEKLQRLTNPNRELIIKALQRAAADVEPGGTLWVYYAGHGAASPTDGRRMLLGVDVMPDESVFEARAVSVGEIEAELTNSAATSVMVMLDTCYGGVGRSGGELLPGTRFAVPTYVKEPDRRFTIWTAASANELSSSYDAAKHGLFTYFAIGALRGWADGEISGEANGSVSLQEAQQYVNRALRSVGSRSQTPTVESTSMTGGMVLSAGNKLEKGPKLDVLAPPKREMAVVPAVDTSNIRPEVVSTNYDTEGLGEEEYLERLEEMRESQEDRVRIESQRKRAHEKAVEQATTPVRAEATRLWRETEKMAANGGPEGEIALREYIERYGTASVVVDGITEPIAIPEVEKAKSTLAKYSSKVLTPKDLRKRKMFQYALITGGVAALSLGIAGASKLGYEKAGPASGQMKALYGANQAFAFGGYTLGVVSCGLFVAGKF
ncbi:MAG: caspase family protein [Proteobacteria bacterium]|jgi:hypothetical protein|nr:caspase family protein [Pseudomonadota bacterium]